MIKILRIFWAQVSPFAWIYMSIFWIFFLIFQKSNPVGAKFTVLALEPIGRTYNPHGKPSLGFIGPFKLMSGHREGQKLGEKIMCPEIKPCQKKQNHEVQASKCISAIFPLGLLHWKLREKYGISHILSRLKSLVFFDKHILCENGSERPFKRPFKNLCSRMLRVC